MVQHIGPTCLHIVAMRLDIGKLRKSDTLEGAFLAQHLNKMLLLGPGVGVPVEIHNILEVARPGALGQGSEFLSEGFDVVIGDHLDPFFRRIGIGMEDFDRLGL